MNFITTIGKAVTTVVLSLAAIFGHGGGVATQHDIEQAQFPHESVTLGSTLPIAGNTYNLAGSGIGSTETSITLTSFTIKQTGQKILDADMSTTFYATIEPGSNTKQEIIGCTTVVQNGNNTATFSGCSRGLSPISPYTASTTLSFVHAGGSQVILSDPPQLFNQYTAKDNNEVITGLWTVPTPVSASGIVNKSYADGLSFGGVATATESSTGFSELATKLEQASSTILGGTGGPVVLQARYATSTYNSSGSLQVVVTKNNNKIDDNFISTSTLFATGAVFGTTTQIGSFPAWQIGKQRQVITTTGTSTFTVPSGITQLYVEVVGGGGAGGNCQGTGSGCDSGGGGGGGYANEIVDVTGTTTIQVYVSPAAAANAAGTWTTFGTNGFYLSATGGAVGTGGSSAGGFRVGGDGGCGSNGDINICGSGGGFAFTSGSIVGNGGGSFLGGGVAAVASPSSGSDGKNYGGGGGGCGATASNSCSGGGGAQGIVIIRW